MCVKGAAVFIMSLLIHLYLKLTTRLIDTTLKFCFVEFEANVRVNEGADIRVIVAAFEWYYACQI